MTDLFESQLTEALHRRADERTPVPPSLAELHHRSRTVPAETTAPDPGRGPRLLLAGVFAAVVAVGGFGAWRALSEDETLQRVDAADQPDVAVDDERSAPGVVDPDDPLTWPVDDGSPERFRKGPDGRTATFEGEVINDEVTVFLDGVFLGRWDESQATWSRPTAEPETGIETGAGQTISEDLTEVTDTPGVLAMEGACLIPGQETWGIQGSDSLGLRVFADRPELQGLLPRPVVEISPRASDIADVESALAGTGLEPNITRVLRFDSDGDGVDEVLIEANSVDRRDQISAGQDEYSLLLLRRIGADGEVETIRLHESIDSIYLFRVTIAAVADLNGDGTFELVTRYDSFESGGGSIWTFDGTPTEVIQGGCGA